MTDINTSDISANNNNDDCEVIFRWSFRHPKTGQIIRAKDKPFPIRLKKKKGVA